MAFESPVGFREEDEEGNRLHEGRPARWIGDNEFGLYLRDLRERAGWTTREAAKHFDVSQAYVPKLENAVRKRPPKMGLLKRVAELYGRDLREVMDEAGFRFDVPVDVEFGMSVDALFAKLMRDPRFRPADFKARDMQFYSPRMKRQILDLLINVWRAGEDDGEFDFDAWLEGESGS